MKAQISNPEMTPTEMKERLNSLEDWQLAAQEIALQGAMNALSHLLMKGCTEEREISMLTSLKLQTSLLNDECLKRGEQPSFNPQNTMFN